MNLFCYLVQCMRCYCLSLLVLLWGTWLVCLQPIDFFSVGNQNIVPLKGQVLISLIHRFCIRSLWDLQGKVIFLLGLKIPTTPKLQVHSSPSQGIWARFVAFIVGTNSKSHYLMWDLSFFPHLQAVLTSIVLKRNVTMLDIVSTRMLGQYGFLAKVRDNACQTCPHS